MWLNHWMLEFGISDNALATGLLRLRRLRPNGQDETEGDDHDKKPRSLVRRWRNATSAPTVTLAFEAGESLRDCGVWWSSGLVAMYAAGYLGDFYSTLSRVAVSHPLAAAQVLYGSAVIAHGGARMDQMDEVVLPSGVGAQLREVAQNNLAGLKRTHKALQIVPRADTELAVQTLRNVEIAVCKAVNAIGAQALQTAFQRRDRAAGSDSVFMSTASLCATLPADATAFREIERIALTTIHRIWLPKQHHTVQRVAYSLWQATPVDPYGDPYYLKLQRKPSDGA